MRQLSPAMSLLATIALIGAALIPVHAQADAIVATVNGQPILSSQLSNELLLRYGDRMLAAMLQELAIAQAAAEAGVTASDADVDDRVQKLQTSIDMQAPRTGQSFTIWLAERKMSIIGLRAFIRSDLLLERMVENEVQVTDAEVADLWERNKAKFRQPDSMNVRHLCVPTKEEADRLRAEIVAGKNFGELAIANSIDPYTKDRGGEFGWITKGDKPFSMASFALTQDGELSQPVQTVMGWHVIQRIEFRPAATPNFEDVQADIRDQLEKQKLLQAIGAKRAEVLASARIDREIEPRDLVTTP